MESRDSYRSGFSGSGVKVHFNQKSLLRFYILCVAQIPNKSRLRSGWPLFEPAMGLNPEPMQVQKKTEP
jgi:hypothetical protein